MLQFHEDLYRKWLGINQQWRGSILRMITSSNQIIIKTNDETLLEMDTALFGKLTANEILEKLRSKVK